MLFELTKAMNTEINDGRKSAGRKSVSDNKHWGTPHNYVKAVRKMFDGEIELDPCSNEHSIVKALMEYSLPEHDGLKESWNYRSIYVNPPYGNDKDRGTTIKHWLSRCAHAHEQFESEVLALVPVATNTSHWKHYVFTKAVGICFLYDTRLKFLENGVNRGKGAPMSCAMVYWGKRYEKFKDIFIEHGAVVNISNLIEEKHVGHLVPLIVKEGDTILFGKFSGTTIEK